ncbi:MAG: nucleoside diphosphate kinase regulator [Adhaeribacter sp.]
MNPIYLTEKDYHRLHQVVLAQRQTNGNQAVEALGKELKRACLVPSTSIPADVVTMNSRVILREKEKGSTFELTLVYPREANVSEHKISVLAPVGTAILGCKVGEEVSWPVGNKTIRYEVEEILYQPEAAGDVNL